MVTHTPQSPLAHLGDALLDVSDGFARVQVLGARARAVHDGVAAEQLEAIVQEVQTLLRRLVARVLNPAVCLWPSDEQEGRTRVKTICSNCQPRGRSNVGVYMRENKPASELPGRGICRAATSNWGKTCCSKRTECTRTCRRDACGLQRSASSRLA